MDNTQQVGTEVVLNTVEDLVNALPIRALSSIKVNPVYFPEGVVYYVGFEAYKRAGHIAPPRVVYKPGTGSYQPTMKQALWDAHDAYWEMVEEGVIIVPKSYTTPTMTKLEHVKTAVLHQPQETKQEPRLVNWTPYINPGIMRGFPIGIDQPLPPRWFREDEPPIDEHGRDPRDTEQGGDTNG